VPTARSDAWAASAVPLRLVLHQDDLRHIARAGPDYLDATSTDPKRQAAAVSLWISDQVAL
jgi:hypothetical protein